jgi:hypothetical protein
MIQDKVMGMDVELENLRPFLQTRPGYLKRASNCCIIVLVIFPSHLALPNSVARWRKGPGNHLNY